MPALRLRVPRAATRLALLATAVALPTMAMAAWRVRVERSRAACAHARERLIAGDAAEALAALSSCREPQADGLRLLSAAWLGLDGQQPETPGEFSWPWRGWLGGMLVAGDIARLERLSLLGQRLGAPSAAGYLAAAWLEQDRDVEAERLSAGRPPAGALERHVRQALEWRAAGARTLVRDRRGLFLGAVQRDGSWRSADPELDRLLGVGLPAALAFVPDEPAVRLSFDVRLTQLAEDALEGVRGSVVLIDLESGDVLAAASDPRTREREPAAALEQRREPASIAKLVTTVAVLRAGLDPDEVIGRQACEGSRRYGSGTLWCSGPGGGHQDLTRALALSCNLAFADLGERVGREALLAEYRRFGFVEPEQAPQAWQGHVVQAEGDERQLADLAIGLEATDTTPLHAARYAAAFADGRLRPVRFVAAQDGRTGFTPRPLPPPQGRQVLEPAWLARLGEAMRAVALWGTASGVAPASFPVAMKTGTGATWRLGYHCNYVGFGPWPRPRLAFAVRVTHAGNSARASRAARQVTARLLDGLSRFAGRL